MRTGYLQSYVLQLPQVVRPPSAFSGQCEERHLLLVVAVNGEPERCYQTQSVAVLLQCHS